MLTTLFHKYLRLPYRLNVHIDKKVKKPIATVVLLHGMGNSGASWDQLVTKLPEGIRVISIDLLGFGGSPSPRWLKYSTSIQAKSVATTLIRMGINQKVIIVGHSMGSLVAVELAKRYPLFVKSLILCSPPFYNDVEKRELLPNPNKILKKFYKMIQNYPKNIVDVVPLALKLKIVGKAFNVTNDNVDIYFAALESSIINQTAFKDIMRIQKPIKLIHGVFDPVVIKKNLDTIVKQNKQAKLIVVFAGHELLGSYVPAVVKTVQEFITPKDVVKPSQKSS